MSEVDQKIKYFQKEPKIYPKRVWGRYRKLKWVSMIVMLAIYYLTPFLRWDRGPNAPDQAILIDMPNRRAYFFFIDIWPQEVYYLTGILILAAVALFFITSLGGRIWCGYACPQTVWTDLFVWVERIVQGDRNARKKLDETSWFSVKKIYQKGLTHILWLFIGLITGGAWVFYFNDAFALWSDIIHFDVSWAILGWIIALMLSTYIMAGFARQQVCKYMCPYARFQSAMFDRDTLIIGYDEKRGEPRGKLKNKEAQHLGDCIDCSLCVQVCPMGIDIRDGLQYECIACGLCIDACNNVMAQIGRPKGLVRYDTTTNQEARDQGQSVPKLFDHIFRLRSFYYVAIMALVAGIMLYSLLNRSEVEMHVLHDRNPLFVKLSDGSIRNGYDIRILNKTHFDNRYVLTLNGIEGAKIEIQGAGATDPEDLPVFADSVGHYRVFVTASKQSEAREGVTFTLKNKNGEASDEIDSVFVSSR